MTEQPQPAAEPAAAEPRTIELPGRRAQREALESTAWLSFLMVALIVALAVLSFIVGVLVGGGGMAWAAHRRAHGIGGLNQPNHVGASHLCPNASLSDSPRRVSK